MRALLQSNGKPILSAADPFVNQNDVARATVPTRAEAEENASSSRSVLIAAKLELSRDDAAEIEGST
jgi:hypothetical protein